LDLRVVRGCRSVNYRDPRWEVVVMGGGGDEEIYGGRKGRWLGSWAAAILFISGEISSQ
jgi:hypothetical protein